MCIRDSSLRDSLEGSPVAPEVPELGEDVSLAPVRHQQLASEMVPAEGRDRAREDHVHPRARLPDVEEVLAVPEGPSLAEAREAADVPVAEWGVDLSLIHIS